MSWGTELWDQWDNINVHTQKGIDFSERYIHFLKERSSVEMDYASKLKKLVKNFQPKKRDEDEYQFTWSRAFVDMLKEVYDMASQHEVVAENLTGTVSRNLQDLVTETKTDRKKYLQDGARLQEQLRQSSQTLDKAKRKYEKAHYDSERSLDNYRKADADINLSRAEVEKHRVVMNGKVQQCEECKNEYAAQLQTHNNHQTEFYSQTMPQVFQQLQDMDERRIHKLQECVLQCAEIEKNVVPIINTCIEGIAKAAGSINTAADSKLVIERYKSGFAMPEDVPFEDLSTGQSIEPSNNQTPRIPAPANSVKNATVSGGKGKKRGGLFGIFGSSKIIGLLGKVSTPVKVDEQKEDFSDLPPNQRRRKLQQKIDSIKKEMAKEHSEREGILKLKDVYAGNPALGDPSTLDKKIEENSQKLDGLRQELLKYEGYMAEAEGKVSRRHSASEDSRSLSTSGSGDTQHTQQVSAPGTPQVQHNVYQPIDGDEDGEDEFDIFPVIGHCRALYPFEAVNEGSVPMGENEEMQILEQDQGDGWTRVRKGDGSEGFVPTSYIECHYYDADQV
ncbi:formin-binding protein 1-like isoform X3 [Aplysia californica]|uniref:Formin-binding protein 1-like isoform X3 n=1 Tax=Aplysia californica TaxID=6500 RepID=A0ABM1W3G6_APLCA|nr:formin-binding protein 1-like isoform X3 [Aplysia californica]